MMNLQQSTRRHFFSQCSMGLGSIALGSLLGRDSARANGVKPFLPGKPHFTPKAKNVIYLFMGGGPSQLELYDWKPELAKRHGGDIPDEFVKGKRFAFMNSTFKQNNKLLGPVKNSASTARAACGSARTSRTLPESPTRSRCFARAKPTCSTTLRPSFS